MQLTAQDLSKMFSDSSAKKTHYPCIATFKGTHLINFHTLEVDGKNTLNFRISHRFGDISTGLYNFYGVDGPASIKLALDYSFDGRTEIGIARSNINKVVDGYLKYRVLRQTEDNHMPLSVTAMASMGETTLNASPSFPKEYYYFSSRLSYCYQLMIARKFSRNFSLQMAPTLVHENLATNLTDKNDIYALVGIMRYKFTRRAAVTAEYSYRLNKYMDNETSYSDVVGLGLDIETGGHVFSIHVTNAYGLYESQFIPYTTSNFFKGKMQVGFNISRAFTLSK
jgi:hypothetical protein